MNRPASLGMLLCAVVVTVAGCSASSEDTSLKRAELRVQAKQRELTKAQAEMSAAASTYCSATGSYIQSLDRYGDILTSTAPTVGDVKEAGTDLSAPREAALQGAQAAVDAQQALLEATQELSEAKAALKEAKSGKTAVATTTSSSTTTPLAPPDSVNRVKRAETEFQSVQTGVSDQTPLAEASQHFNAAAVALEMSWLALFADTGCLTDEQQQQAEAAVSEYTASLQEALAGAGYYTGAVDGVYGPETVDAVEALQQASGLPVTGTVDKATEAALRAELADKGAVAARGAVASTAALQQTLKLAGFWDGPVDGQWSPALTKALESFQTELGVKPTGEVDAATIAAFEKAIAEAQKAPPTSPPPSTEPPTPTASPTSTPSSSPPT